mmetsp:Transcript_14944/g.47077  ORF Transcript_14944/g.47077 Transcript_14944/m.47077 type:complete len:292 (+) Transcript_14944:437-1312(+)
MYFRGCWPFGAQVELIFSGTSEPEARLPMALRACSWPPAATQGWPPGPEDTGPVEGMELVPLVATTPKAPLKPFELLRVPSGWEACEPVLCIVIDGFCSVTAPAALNVLRFVPALLSRLPLIPPIGGSTIPSSGSSLSLAPPPPPMLGFGLWSWVLAGPPAPAAPVTLASPAPTFRRSCRMVGSPPVRSSAAPAGLKGSLGATSSGVWAWPMLAVLLLALRPSLAGAGSGGAAPRLPAVDCTGGAVPAARSFSASRKSLKYGSLSACRARIRSSGSYLMSFFISSTSSGSA